jgi:transposase
MPRLPQYKKWPKFSYKKLLLKLVKCASEKDVERIAKELGVKKPVVVDGIMRLVDTGSIEPKKGPPRGRRGKRRTTPAKEAEIGDYIDEHQSRPIETTSGEIMANLQLPVGRRRVNQLEHEQGYHSHPPANKAVHPAEKRAKRLIYCHGSAQCLHSAKETGARGLQVAARFEVSFAAPGSASPSETGVTSVRKAAVQSSCVADCSARDP